MDIDLRLGDCLGVLRALADNSIDALVTDPPAGIGFMGKAWDGNKGGRDYWIAWLQERMAECLRVLKPGAHGLVWALPRTSHWTATALEDAGFEIRDRVSHFFGSGFPKSLNLGDGRGTALKPACEDWWLVRKPLAGTVAANVAEYGTGALNIDASRVGTGDGGARDGEASADRRYQDRGSSNFALTPGPRGGDPLGRWPANIVFSHTPDCVLVGEKKVKAITGGANRTSALGLLNDDGWKPQTQEIQHFGDAEGMEAVEDWQCAPDCAVAELDRQSGDRQSGSMRAGTYAGRKGDVYSPDAGRPLAADIVASNGGASRFFYVAKPATSERDAGLDGFHAASGGEATGRKDDSAGLKNPRAGAGRGGGRKNIHPTVKPIELMRYLCRLITPRGGLVLDPFLGSGTTGIAARLEGFRFLGIEAAAEYLDIARARIEGDAPLLNRATP